MKGWKERFPARYAAEKEHWLAKDFVETRSDEVVEFEGRIELRLSPAEGPVENKSYLVKLRYEEAYPFVPPEVIFVEPKVKRSRHLSPSGTPCLFPVRDWTSQVPASEVEKKVVQWLTGHEFGAFPNELPLYELPDYYEYEPPTILRTEAAVQATRPKNRGRFSLQVFKGRKLAVLATVDSKPVGKDLVDELGLPHGDKFNGKWFRIAGEPPPIRSEADLILLLAKNNFTLKITEPGHVRYVALVFEDEHLKQSQWVTFVYGHKGSRAKPPRNLGWKLRSPRTHLVSEQELFSRIESVRPLDVLEEKKVTIFGLGAIGSHAAIGIAREGVGNFTLCDPDVLKPGNIVRHALSLAEVGQAKAAAVADAIARTNPFAATEHLTTELSNPFTMSGALKDADLALGLIGDDNIEELLTEVVVDERRCPLIVGRTLYGGSAIRIVRVIPGIDPCLTCLKLHVRDQNPDLIVVPHEDLPDVYDNGCSTAARPGTGVASEHAAVLVVEKAISMLLSDQSVENHWLLVRKGIPGGDPRISKAGSFASTFPIHAECGNCHSD